MGVESVLEPLRGREMHIWFVLLMWHAGRVWWLGSFENQSDCIEAQREMEKTAAPGDLFACPPVQVERT